MVDNRDPLSEPRAAEIGREMARAVEAEERHRRESPASVSPLHGVSYDATSGALNLYRLVKSPTDEAIRSFTERYKGLSPDQQEEIRARLSMDEFYALLAFARRCALRTLRSERRNTVSEGVIALTAIDGERVDWRDVSVAAALLSYAGQGAASGLLRDSAARADRTVSEILLRFAKDPVDDLRDWGYCKVMTADGPALFETGGRRFEPVADLTGIARQVAALLESDLYRVRGIGVGSDLPKVWLRGGDRDAVSTAVSSLTGCVVVHATLDRELDPHAEAQQLTAFVAEAATERDATLIATAATGGAAPAHEALGLGAGSLCCILIGRSFVQGVPSFEKPGALERFRSPLRKALGAWAEGR